MQTVGFSQNTQCHTIGTSYLRTLAALMHIHYYFSDPLQYCPPIYAFISKKVAHIYN